MKFQVPPDMYQFAANLRQIVENENPTQQGMMFALGRSKGLRIKTLAGMADCSESHVYRMLLLVKLPARIATAVAEGAPYTPLIRSLRSGEPLPEV